MPCCKESIELEQYIQEYIIGYSGLAHVKDLLLGGIAQQKIVVSEENRKKLQENGFTTTYQAELKVAAASVFSASTKTTTTEEFDQTKLNTFKKFSQQSNIITLGGSTNVQTIEEWSKTVSSNPTIIKFSIASFLNLLTVQRFPTDPTIASKKGLIEKTQQKYIDSLLFCYNNCSQKGPCQPTGSFGFGQCRCNSGWSGVDCSMKVRVPTGLLSNVYPNNTCPVGYTLGKHNFGASLGYNGGAYYNPMALPELGRFRTCWHANGTGLVETSGTFCGITYGSPIVSCDKHNPYSEPCPLGYSKYSWVTLGPGPSILYTCQKDSISSSDLPGTLCGLHSSLDSGDQIICDGYYPARGKCPSDYILARGSFSSNPQAGIVTLCVKS